MAGEPYCAWCNRTGHAPTLKCREGYYGQFTTDKAAAWDAVIEARQDEREKCIKIAERVADEIGDGAGEVYIARKIVDAIRASDPQHASPMPPADGK